MDFMGIDAKTVGGTLGGLLVLLAIGYRAYQVLKSDSKGDKVDERASNFTTLIQAQLDKAILRIDKLQAENTALQMAYAETAAQLTIAKSRAEFLAAENQRLRENGAAAIPKGGP